VDSFVSIDNLAIDIDLKIALSTHMIMPTAQAIIYSFICPFGKQSCETGEFNRHFSIMFNFNKCLDDNTF